MSAVTLVAPRNLRYQSLDLWRGLACLLVVLFHSSGVAFLTLESARRAAGPNPHQLGVAQRQAQIGWVGVPFFFVISGYAISATARPVRRRTGGTGTYFRRRLRRIYPPYWAMVALQVLILLAVDVLLSPRLLTGSIAPIERPWEMTPGQWLGNITLTESWRAAALPFNSERDYILGQAWTLCYEEQFYIVTGMALLLFPAKFFQIAASVTVFTAIVAVLAPIPTSEWAASSSIGYWLAFAAGILVYWQVNYSSSATRRWTWGLLSDRAGVRGTGPAQQGRDEPGSHGGHAVRRVPACGPSLRWPRGGLTSLRPLALPGRSATASI